MAEGSVSLEAGYLARPTDSQAVGSPGDEADETAA